jgi:MFS family permease
MTSAVILRLIAGVGLVGVYTPGMRIVAERFSTKGRGMAVGFYVTAFYAANSVSLAVTGALMSHFDWRDSYLIISIAAAAAIPLAYVLLRKHRHIRAQGSSGRLDIGVLKKRAVRLYIMGYSLHAAELYIVRVWLPVFLVAILVARGMNNAQAAATAATVAGISLAFGSIGPVIGGILSDRWGRASSASVIFGLSGLCSFAIGWMAGFPWVVIIALTVVYGWAVAADSAIYSTAVTEVADRHRLGSTMAMHSFLGFMGGVISPVVFGGILDVSADSIQWGIGFTFTGVLAIVAISSLTRLRNASPVRV